MHHIQCTGTPACGMPAACATSPRSCLLWLGPSGAGSLESVLWLQFWLQGWWRVESQEFDPYLPSSLNLKLAQGATSSCWHLGGPNWTEVRTELRSELNCRSSDQIFPKAPVLSNSLPKWVRDLQVLYFDLHIVFKSGNNGDWFTTWDPFSRVWYVCTYNS